ncbi:murein L,D-transpeptidase family protein [Myxococcota bacterium]
MKLVFALAATACCAHAQGTPDDSATDACAGRATSVLIDLDEHTLWLCETGQVAGEYSVSLGKGGVGKQIRGDNKTPVGTYSLGAPRPSKKFGIFIPVGYPTAAQKKAGFSGSAIGIHGPDRSFTWAGTLNTLIDWTQGCIAVKSDEAIGTIAAWVNQENPELVHLVE